MTQASVKASRGFVIYYNNYAYIYDCGHYCLAIFFQITIFRLICQKLCRLVFGKLGDEFCCACLPMIAYALGSCGSVPKYLMKIWPPDGHY